MKRGSLTALCARAALGTAGVFLTAAAPASGAMLNKHAPGRCGGGSCDSFAELAGLFFKNNVRYGEFAMIIRALTAAFLLCALACLVSGWVAIANGTPGGSQRLLAGTFGIVVVIAMMGVVL